MTVSAPGVAAEDLTIEAADGRLTIRGETSTTAHTHFVNYSVALPPDADADSVSAASADGLLTLTVPKKAKAAPKRIAVSAAAEEDEEKEEAEEASDRPYKLTVVAAGLAASDVEVVAEDGGVLTVKGE